MKRKNQNIQIENDANFLREFAKEKQLSVPASVGTEVITNLVKDEKQKKNTGRTVKRCVAVALCLAVFVSSVIVSDRAIYNPGKLGVYGMARAESYDSLLAMIKDYADSERLLYYYMSISSTVNDGMLNGYVEEKNESTDTAVGTGSSSVSSEGSFSALNTREENVDEGWIFRTDGKYIYKAGNNIDIITPADENGEMHIVSTLNIREDLGKLYVATATDGRKESDVRVYPLELLLYKNYLIISAEYYADNKNSSGVIIYDISDKTQPVLVRCFFQSGAGIDVRISGDMLIMVTNWTLNLYDGKYTVEHCIPFVSNGSESSIVACDDIVLADTKKPNGYNIVSVADLSDLSKAPSTTALLGMEYGVYCTKDKLFIYGDTYEKNKMFMNVSAFDLTVQGAVYLGDCCFEGSFYDSFSMDWDGNYLRAAVTTDKTNKLYIFNSALEKVGEISSFGEGESIYAIRFIGNFAYAVTFFQTDPLFVLDLTNPEKPFVAGELVMPGFSSYLHPVGENLLLGIGTDGDSNGANGNAKISLYDVSDHTNPKILDEIVIEHAWLSTDYRSFCLVPDDNSYIIPCQRYFSSKVDNGVFADVSFEYGAGAVRVRVNEDNTLSLTASYSSSISEIDYDEVNASLVVNGNVYLLQSFYVSAFTKDGKELSVLETSSKVYYHYWYE